jgi:hypothetical protein
VITLGLTLHGRVPGNSRKRSLRKESTRWLQA